MRIRLAVPLVSVVLGVFGFAGSAQAQDFSADFAVDAQDFAVFEVDSEGIASVPFSHFMSGGNPGGFIGFVDDDSGGDEPNNVFVPPLSIDSAQIGGLVSFDLRSTATPVTEAFISVGDASNPQVQGRVTCKFGVPSSAWSTYSVAITPDDPCWRNEGGQDATAGDFGLVFDSPTLISAWSIGADFSSAAGEQADLDNFFLGEWVLERKVKLRYKKRSRSFIGVISQDDGQITDACIDTVAVELYREAGADDKRLDTELTQANGKFKFAKKAKKNKEYYAFVPLTGEEPTCASASSKTIKPLKRPA